MVSFGVRAVIAGLSLALALSAAAPASAASGSVSARIEPQGYARIAFSFDRMPRAQARLANSVLVVSFDEPVDLQTADLARGLGAFVGVIRRDPDGTSIRMALERPVKLVTTEAGETLFVDLLPSTWSGLPPPLPLDVIATLTRQAREARELKAEEERRRARPDRKLTIEGATHPTFRRLVFDLGGDAPVSAARDGERVRVTIGAPYALDLAAARAKLPIEFAGLDAERTAGGLVVSAPAPKAANFRAFREDGDFILDIDRTEPAALGRGDDHATPETPAPPGADHADGHAAAPAKAPTVARPPAPVAPAAAASPPKAARTDGAHADPHQADAGRAPVPAPVPHPTPAQRHVDAHHEAPTKALAPAAKPVASPSVRRSGETVHLVFPFPRATAAAAFSRGKTLWVVFDDPSPIDFGSLVKASAGAVLSAEEVAVEQGRAARLRIADRHLVSAAVEGTGWIVSLGDETLQPTAAIQLRPAFDEDGRATVELDLPGLGAVHAIRDPEVGDLLTVATLKGPARNVPRPQQFVEFSAAATAQGVVIGVAADDVRVLARLDRLSVERDAGLTLSNAQAAPGATASVDPHAATVLGAAAWKAENDKPFRDRENELIEAAALASAEVRPEARLALARFYQARDRAAESKAVLDAIVDDGGLPERDPRLAILRAAAEVELRRPGAALAILNSSAARMRPEASLWRAAAEAAFGRAGPARTALRQGESAIAALPPQLQARFIALGVDLALDAGDAATAAAEFERLEVLPAFSGVAARELARARVAEALGQIERAAAAYASIAKREDSAAAADAEFRSINLALKMGALKAPEAIARFERLTTGWRGDAIEAKALSRLIELYADAARWRDAFSTLKVAVEAFPDADGARALQDRMQERFTDLFLGAGADSLPRLDALALFYDFKEMSPGGKRGDELVRRLADKLVEVDLLDQAADLLGYQIENRLTGAARAQVAARAALIDLMNAKPARALETLRKTRQADLPASLMRDRLTLEARALAETGRTDLALEIAAGLEAPASARLKADILWSARRWSEAGEALEAMLGSNWRGSEPLDAGRRADVMRAAIALSLAEDGLGVDRFRQKYASKMADGPDAASFEVVTAPLEARGDAFREIARSVAASASFHAFVAEYRRGASQPAVSELSASGLPPKA